MNIVIITGGSKGIGKALGQYYANNTYKVYSMSRTITDIQNVTQLSVDLTNTKKALSTFNMLLDEIKKQDISSITLINNAGRLGKISNLEKIPVEDIEKSIQLNITIPSILSKLFIQQLQRLTCKKQIINITSGAAISPYAGWSTYCSTKAALDMLTMTIATEQDTIEYPVKCIGIRPGVVDTNMQAQIRRTDKSDFQNLQKFIDLKTNNQLYSSEFVAESIFKIDTENTLKSGDIVDIRLL